jgi:hypothetical protein
MIVSLNSGVTSAGVSPFKAISQAASIRERAEAANDPTAKAHS